MAFMDGNGARTERNRSTAVALGFGLKSSLECYSITEPVSAGVGFHGEQFNFDKACTAAYRSHRKPKRLKKQKAFQLEPSHQSFHPPHFPASFYDRFKVVEEAAQAGKNHRFLMSDLAYIQPWKPRDRIKARDKRSSPGKTTQVSQDELQHLYVLQPPAMASESLNFDTKFRPVRTHSTTDATNQRMTVAQDIGQRKLPVDKLSDYFSSEDEGSCSDLSLCCGRQSTTSSNLSPEPRSQRSFQNRKANFVCGDKDRNSAQRVVAGGVDHRFCRENEPCLALSLTCADHGTEHCQRLHTKSARTQVRELDTQGENINCAKMSQHQTLLNIGEITERPKGSNPLTAEMPADAVQFTSSSNAFRSTAQFSFNGQNSTNDRSLTPPRSEISFKEESIVRRRILRRHGRKNCTTAMSENRDFYNRLLGFVGSSIKSDENLSNYNRNTSNDDNEGMGKNRSVSEEDMKTETQPRAYLPLMAPPLVRSKRGRSQYLPSRFKDSVLGSWKRETR